MLVKNLIARLKNLNPEARILIANDEELNKLFDNVHIASLDTPISKYVLYPDERTNRTKETMQVGKVDEGL